MRDHSETGHPAVIDTPRGVALLLALMIYVSFIAVFRPMSTSRTDFPCFYRAGAMVLSGDAANVYDLEAERTADIKLWGRMQQPDRPYTLPFVFAPWTLLIFGAFS